MVEVIHRGSTMVFFPVGDFSLRAEAKAKTKTSPQRQVDGLFTGRAMQLHGRVMLSYVVCLSVRGNVDVR